MTTTYTLGQTAKRLGMGRSELCRTLREAHVLNESNYPDRRHLAAGMFQVRERPYMHYGLGRQRTSTTTLVTTRGLQWLALQLGRPLGDGAPAANDD